MILNIIEPLLAEQARLEDELRQMAVFRRLEAVRASIASLRSAYDETPAGMNKPSPAPDGGTINASQTATRRRHVRSMTGRVVEIAEAAMRSTGRRFQSPEILELAAKEGVSVAGEKPNSVVSSILSHDDLFDNTFDKHGRGYGLKEWSRDSESIKSVDALKENEPPAGSLVGSDAAGEGVPPPDPALDYSNSPERGS